MTRIDAIPIRRNIRTMANHWHRWLSLPWLAACALAIVGGSSSAFGQDVDEDDHEWILQWNEPASYPGAGNPILPSAEELKDVQIDSALREMVAQLEDPSFEVRERANRSLVETQPDRKQLYAMLVLESGLTAEQRYRVLAALRESLLLMPRGAVGISMQTVQINMGGPIEVRVTELIPGLPAERVLKVGDRISHVDGNALNLNADLPFRVQSKKPGEKVMLAIKRPKVDVDGRPMLDLNDPANYEQMEIELELGSADMLESFNEVRGVQFNQLTNSSRVSTMRQAEADTAARRLSPPARAIALNGSQVQSADQDIEQDPVVRRLMQQKEQFLQAGATRDDLAKMQEEWQFTLMDLYSRSQSRNLTADQRDYLQDVFERASELMTELTQAHLNVRVEQNTQPNVQPR